MEQTKLPIKTKIVAFSMIIISVYIMIVGLMLRYGFMGDYQKISLFTSILNGLLFLIFSFFLSNKKKFSWWPTIIIFSIILISAILSGPSYPDFNKPTIFNIIAIPFISPIQILIGAEGTEGIGWLITIILLIVLLFFLIIDRKNFWKIAS